MSAEPKHEHCWICDTELQDGICPKCGPPVNSMEVQQQIDEADRERRRREYFFGRRQR